MIFGSPTEFAIEIGRLSTSGLLYGHVRLWIAGSPIGDFEENALLSGFSATVRSWASSWPGRIDDEMAELDGQSIFARLQRLPRTRFADARAADDAFRRVAFAPNETASFDGDTVLLVPSSTGRTTMAVRPFRHSEFSTHHCASDVVVGALTACDAWLHERSTVGQDP